MDAFLNVTQKIQAYGDRSISSNPRVRLFDVVRDQSGVPCKDPKAEGHEIDPGATKLIWNGTRSTTIGVTTAFDLSLSTLDPSRYRFTWSAGSNPTLRTDRGLALNGRTLTVSVQANNSVVVTVSGAGSNDFTGVIAGDTVFIPHTTTGDSANVLSVLNAGYWQVLAVLSPTSLSLARFPGASFEATGESQVLSSDAQIRAFSTNGVQVGDKVNISSGFATVTRQTFQVVAVTSTFFEVVSTTALPAETAITPGSTGMVFYTDSKKFVYIEADQLCAVRLNGATDDTQVIEPDEPGNQEKPGTYSKRGPAWSLVLVNKSAVTVNVVVLHAE